MKDLALKNAIVSNKLDKIARRLSFLFFKNCLTFKEYEEMHELSYTMSKYNDDVNRVCHNLNNNRYYRISKCRDFIQKFIFNASEIFGFKVLFLTLTFNDETLQNTTELARRKRIKRFLQCQCISFIANIDFGEKNEREHYHAICLMDLHYDLSKYEKNGFFKAENVNLDAIDNERITKYLNKLTYHAIKDTTQHDNTTYRCIYYTRFKK